MNVWLGADLVFIVAIAACGVFTLRGPRLADAFVALQLAGLATALLFVVSAIGTHRPSFIDLGLVLALTSFPSGVLFVHFIDRSDR